MKSSERGVRGKGGEIGFDRETAGVKLPVEFVGNSLKN